MTIKPYHNIAIAIEASKHHLLNTGRENKVDKWQGIDAPRPMFEAFDLAWKAPIPESIYDAERLIKPNLPWAEEHFQERISGIPHNPPPSHERWPFGQKNNKKFTEQEKFTHTYPERFWPKYDGVEIGAIQIPTHYDSPLRYMPGNLSYSYRKGIRFEYGDYNDLIQLLRNEPSTRQAYLPIFFPEDTGAVHRGRVPCTLGYLFYMRNGYLHISYHMRACDYLRHFRDDIYMAVRLAQHTLDCLQYIAKQHSLNDKTWLNVKLGYLTFHADNFHVFSGEEKTL